jgi:phenylalanine-4-hydroxylase
VINQYFEIDHYQPLLFVIDSFEQLFEQVETLELWMRHGRLGNVSPGEPAVSAEDVKSFIDAAQHGKLAD